MTAMILDPKLESELIAQRAAWGGDRFDEVWEGVYMMSPLADDEHQELVSQFVAAIHNVLGSNSPFKLRPGVNVSDRETDWKQNYRCPDVVVFAPDTTAKNCGTFWFGGPDFAVEITSPHDRSRDKFEFYAKVKVRELLIVDRDRWALEMYRLDGQELRLEGSSSLADGNRLTSNVLGVTLHLIPGRPDQSRPAIEVTKVDGGQSWIV